MPKRKFTSVKSRDKINHKKYKKYINYDTRHLNKDMYTKKEVINLLNQQEQNLTKTTKDINIYYSKYWSKDCSYIS